MHDIFFDKFKPNSVLSQTINTEKCINTDLNTSLRKVKSTKKIIILIFSLWLKSIPEDLNHLYIPLSPLLFLKKQLMQREKAEKTVSPS